MTKELETIKAELDNEYAGRSVIDIQSIADGSDIVSSFTGEDFATKIKIGAAVSGAKSLRDEMLNKKFNLKNFVIQRVQLASEETGVIEDVARVILIDDKDNAYASVSTGVLSALKTIIGVAGMPEQWDSAIPCTPAEETTRKKFRVLTLRWG